MVERWLVRAAASAPPQSRLELRLRPGPDPRRAKPTHPDADRRAQSRMPGAEGGATHQQPGRDRGAGRCDVSARYPREHPLRQWSRDDIEGLAEMGRQKRSTDPVNCARVAVGE